MTACYLGCVSWPYWLSRCSSLRSGDSALRSGEEDQKKAWKKSKMYLSQKKSKVKVIMGFHLCSPQFPRSIRPTQFTTKRWILCPIAYCTQKPVLCLTQYPRRRMPSDVLHPEMHAISEVLHPEAFAMPNVLQPEIYATSNVLHPDTHAMSNVWHPEMDAMYDASHPEALQPELSAMFGIFVPDAFHV